MESANNGPSKLRRSFTYIKNSLMKQTGPSIPEDAVQVSIIQDEHSDSLLSDDLSVTSSRNRTRSNLFRSFKKKFIRSKLNMCNSKQKVSSSDLKPCQNAFTTVSPVSSREYDGLSEYIHACLEATDRRSSCFERADTIGDVIRNNANEITGSKNSRGLSEEIFTLARFGWYWGPVSRQEAEEKLHYLQEGAFLVRDSTSDNYLFTVSFRSSGRTLHARIEHSCGSYSFYAQEGFPSIAELIENATVLSKTGVYCYSRPRGSMQPAFPVRLTTPVSRFTQVRSLQYLCRFVIRQYTNVDNIQRLPIPKPIQGYIQQGYY